MTCRRAYDLDLAEFLLDPRDERFADFRAHYPRCADCAAEVAAWTALEAALAGEHPDEEALLVFADRPEALDPARRRAIATHVDRCPSCLDELRALARFDASRAAGGPVDEARAHRPAAPAPADEARAGRPAAAGAPAAPAKRSGRAALHAARRILWHPALPYAALLALVLLPALRAQLGAPGPGQGGGTAAPIGVPPAAAPAPVFRREVLPPPQAANADAVAAAAAPRPETAEVGGGENRAAAASVPATSAAAPRDRSAPGAGAGALAKQPAPLASGAAGELGDERVVSRPSEHRREPDAAGGQAGERAELRLGPARADGSRRLTIALDAAPAGTDVDVRVRDASGAREVRQRVALGAGERRIELDLPSAWLDAPAYDVEVESGGAVIARGAVRAR